MDHLQTPRSDSSISPHAHSAVSAWDPTYATTHRYSSFIVLFQSLFTLILFFEVPIIMMMMMTLEVLRRAMRHHIRISRSVPTYFIRTTQHLQ